MSKMLRFLESLNLKDNSTIRIDCPSCRSKNTFTVYNDMGTYVYNCFKLSCKYTGAYSVGMTAAEIKDRINKKKSNTIKELQPLVYPVYVVDPLPEHTKLHNFIERWDLQGEGLMYDVKDRRAVFPIMYKGRLLDAVGRALDGAIPKWYRYSGNAEFFTKRVSPDANTAVIVEDVISAIKVAHYAPSAVGFAILGTSIGVSIMQQLSDYDKVIVALDPDAAAKTLQYKREIELWTGLPTTALRLDDDIKYGLESDIFKLKEMM